MRRQGAIRGELLFTMLLFVAGCGEPPPPLDTSGPTGDWPHYGQGLEGLRYSPLDQIRPDNVAYLEEVWRYESGDFALGDETQTRTSLQVTPIVVGERLIFCTPYNRVIALDPETGEELWQFDPELQLRRLHGAYPMICRGVAHWQDAEADGGNESECRERIFTGTQDAELIALDAATGRPCADFGEAGRLALRDDLGDDVPPWEYYVTSAPLVVDDLVIVGALVADNVRADAPPGVVRAFDARTGELAWAWDPVPPDHPATPAEGPYRRSTANVWAPMAADAERGLLFVPTGNAPPDYFGGQRNGLDHYSSSVVALHTRGERAGEVAWHFQTVHHDLWDYDIGAQPSLIELNTDDGPVAAVVVSTKAGHVFVLDRESGEPLHPIEERPVPQDPAPGEWLSPTQPFPVTPPTLFPPQLTPDDAWGLTFWDRGRCRREIESRRAEGLYTPPSLEGTVVYPAATGGINWGSGAVDPSRNLLVVNQSRVPTGVRLIPREEYAALPEEETRTDAGGLAGANRLYSEMRDTPYGVSVELLSSPLGMPCSAPPWGTLTAVDLDDGEIRWEVPLGSTRGLAPWPFWLEWGVPNVGGPIVTAGGLAFIAATPDRYIRAFDLASGETLWRADLPYAAHATPLTYRLGPERRQFLVVAAGGHLFSDPGDAIVAFALPEPE
ncbi:pyrroloquinoline quinone-dependent dehydrogenase [Halomonas sp. EGI 63088]|uniref:Pyrroloquinoline quinone-dependent dehydrogenase n=1 Tax=Halomonas flagellata TaxID=2920385 RepID=A0ABS9RRR6_9GAMM|nr:pyrroloquinoline quinone-dependent dehydrogenase [Halomonas flagellata]MCH4562537.1 pyrroloquinoline quinone-dependent dehydrogenase [Halomonas flagellata]